MHRTTPQTAAFGLTDSPVGLAAWIVEKLRAWSDCDGDVERRFTKDEILTNLALYWLTGTIGSSMRMYRASSAIPAAQHGRRVEVPSGFSLFPGDIVRPPRAWLERTANVVYMTEPARGGHFAPFEEPELLRGGAAHLLPPLPPGRLTARDPARCAVRRQRTASTLSSEATRAGWVRNGEWPVGHSTRLSQRRASARCTSGWTAWSWAQTT